ncbi:MAG: DinB family protein [Terriglobia bacterium]
MTKATEALSDLVQYSAWASQKLLTFAQTVPEDVIARAIPNSHGGILKTFQHIYYADRVWLSRLEQAVVAFEDPPPGPSLAQLDRAWWPLLDRLAAFADGNDPDANLAFQRTNGDTHSLQIGPLLRHIVNHGTYHRGQIASMLRESGFVPPSTDLLYYHLKI